MTSPLDELPPDLAEELEIIAMEALRRAPGSLLESSLKRDMTTALRRYNARAEVRIERQGAGLAAVLVLPSPRNRVRRIRFTIDPL